MWSKIWKLVVKVFLKLALSFIGTYLVEVLPIAEKVVAELAKEEALTDEQKRKEAFERIKKELKYRSNLGVKKGINNVINMAIEIAVAKMKI